MSLRTLALVSLAVSVLPLLLAEFPLSLRMAVLGGKIVDSIPGRAAMIVAALVGLALLGYGRQALPFL